jgi:hypothetical protein
VQKVLHIAQWVLCAVKARFLIPSIVGSFSETQSGGNILPRLKPLPTSKNAIPLAQVTP